MLPLTQILIHSSFISFYLFFFSSFFFLFSKSNNNNNKNKNGQKLGYDSCPLFIIFTMQKYWKISFSFSFV